MTLLQQHIRINLFKTFPAPAFPATVPPSPPAGLPACTRAWASVAVAVTAADGAGPLTERAARGSGPGRGAVLLREERKLYEIIHRKLKTLRHEKLQMGKYDGLWAERRRLARAKLIPQKMALSALKNGPYPAGAREP